MLPVIPKATGGEYTASCIVSAYNSTSGEAFLYVEFKEKVRQIQLENYMQTMDATEVRFDTFSAKTKNQVSTYDDECAKTLFTFHKKSKEPGWTLVERGTPSVETKAPAEPSAAEFLAQEREDLLVQEDVMRADPDAFQHDGGYAGPILGKQKMAGQAESPSGSGGRKRQRGRALAMLHAGLESLAVEETEMDAMADELAKAKEDNVSLSVKNDNLEVDNAGLATEIGDLKARNNQLEMKAGTLIQMVRGLSKEKSGAARSSREEVSVKNSMIVELLADKERLKVEKTEAIVTAVQLRADKDTLEQRVNYIREFMGEAGPTALSSDWMMPDIRIGGSKAKFVFRFVGPIPSSLESAYGRFRVKTFKTAAVGIHSYVFVHADVMCTRAEFEVASASVLGAATTLEFISHHSRIAARDQSHGPQQWTPAMFECMISRALARQ